MAKAGDTLVSPTGDSLMFLQTAADTGGQVLEVEVAYAPGRRALPAHFHPYQTEQFEVVSGAITTRIGGREKTFVAGERFEVPAGVPHLMWNGGADVARMRWQVRPALRTEQFFEALWQLAEDVPSGARQRPGLLQFAVIAREYDREFRLARLPFPVQTVLFEVLGTLGMLLGYRTMYAAPSGTLR